MRKPFTFLLLSLLACQPAGVMQQSDHPEKPWVFWYWMQASVSREGITADLDAMKSAGIGGAYLMPIKGPTDPPLTEPPVTQLTPEWWEMVRFAMEEAKRLGLQLGMHASDGFALAGGPWITPELSMQKVVWKEVNVIDEQEAWLKLLQPEGYKGYYEDIAVFAFPTEDTPTSTYVYKPTITTSDGKKADFLVVERNNEEQYRCNEDCWFQYAFSEPFTCQSIRVITKGNNYQSHRLRVQSSNDGIHFDTIYQMVPPRHGWQDTDAQVTYSIPKTTARYFRFQWSKEGSEPGTEDLDAAKWGTRLKIAGLQMSSQPKIHQFEGKTGEVWRISSRTTDRQLTPAACIALDKLINITDKMDTSGVLHWKVPEGNWTILRIGHTSTGHTNYTGGGGLGLECDKFNPIAINLQFDKWYGQVLEKMGPELSDEVFKVFHVDSWECGSQNWSPVFREEFKRRRGYDPLTYLPVMAGYPVNSAEFSEKFLYDIRQTITELMIDNFYGIMKDRAHKYGVLFSAESVAPTMLSDGMRHYGEVDLPMGEFWFRSPTHDKLNDMLDATSGAHIYGKKIIQAEGFTELRMAWDEHPGMLKTLLDRNYALGINRLVFHVFTHNPWIDRKPGMTLDGVGLYFQRDQTWWKSGAEFVTYAERCQKLLQEGQPVIDIAAFAGEGLPRRSILPDRLIKTLPGIYGKEAVEREQIRLANENQPQRELPIGVKHSANMADPEDWLDPLNGYKYDSFSKDALLDLAYAEDGDIRLNTGMNYRLLILPQPRKMDPDPEYMSKGVLRKLAELIKNGGTILISEKPIRTPGLDSADQEFHRLANEIWEGSFELQEGFYAKSYGKGRVIRTPITAGSFRELDITPDFRAFENNKKADNIAWTHRRNSQKDIYFISNQSKTDRILELSLRVTGKVPEIYDPVSDERTPAKSWIITETQTELPVRLAANGSLFIILESKTNERSASGTNWRELSQETTLESCWTITFNPELGGPAKPVVWDSLQSWTENEDPDIKYYSGTAIYTTTFDFQPEKEKAYFLHLKELHNLAEVTVNDKPCGIIWTAPYQAKITDALQKGKNSLDIAVTNTWRNRLIGDHRLPESERITWTTAPYRLEGQPLLKAGLMGSVRILAE